MLTQDQYRQLAQLQYSLIWQAHYGLRLKPRPTDKRILFEDGLDDPMRVVIPAPRYMAMLRHGGLVFHLRAPRDDAEGRPVFDGDGHLLGPVSEDDAMAYIAWRVVPEHVQARAVGSNRPLVRLCTTADLPATREFRNAWRLSAEPDGLIDMDEAAKREIEIERRVQAALAAQAQERQRFMRARVEQELFASSAAIQEQG